MKNVVIALTLVVSSFAATANPFYSMLKAEDMKRICEPSTDERVNASLREDFQEIVSAMKLSPDQVGFRVTGCSGYASAAVTLQLVVVSPRLVELPREERLFLLAHEIGHVVNGDVHHWHELGDKLVSSANVAEDADKLMPELSQQLERGADGFAAKALHVLGINSATAARSFFRRAGLLNLPGTRSHPAARERVTLLSQAAL